MRLFLAVLCALLLTSAPARADQSGEALRPHSHVHFATVPSGKECFPVIPNDDGFYFAYKNGDYEVAFKAWLLLANKGQHSAQCGVGWLYETGLGTNMDKTEANKWFQKAEEHGATTAADNSTCEGLPDEYLCLELAQAGSSRILVNGLFNKKYKQHMKDKDYDPELFKKTHQAWEKYEEARCNYLTSIPEIRGTHGESAVLFGCQLEMNKVHIYQLLDDLRCDRRGCP